MSAVNRKYQRPEVKQITRQWVKENLKNITERDMGLLRLLYNSKRRILRRDQIEILYPIFASTDRLNKRLKALYQMHVIDKIYPQVGIGKGSSKQHICLDRAGIILLGLDKYNKPIVTDKEGNKTLPLGWEHKVMINDYECMIRQFIDSTGATLKDYVVEEHHSYLDTSIIPDIFTFITLNNKGYLFFIEVDLGTEDMPYIKSKIDSYINYYHSRQWVNHEWAKKFKNPVFPRVLFLTENNKKNRILKLQEYTDSKSVRFYIGGHDQFNSILNSIIKD